MQVLLRPLPRVHELVDAGRDRRHVPRVRRSWTHDLASLDHVVTDQALTLLRELAVSAWQVAQLFLHQGRLHFVHLVTLLGNEIYRLLFCPLPHGMAFGALPSVGLKQLIFHNFIFFPTN